MGKGTFLATFFRTRSHFRSLARSVPRSSSLASISLSLMLCFSCASFVFSLNLIWFCFVGKKFLCNFLIFFSSVGASPLLVVVVIVLGCVCILWAVSRGVWAWDVDAAAALGFVCLLLLSCGEFFWVRFTVGSEGFCLGLGLFAL
jgi:hypothetical protein